MQVNHKQFLYITPKAKVTFKSLCVIIREIHPFKTAVKSSVIEKQYGDEPVRAQFDLCRALAERTHLACYIR